MARYVCELHTHFSNLPPELSQRSAFKISSWCSVGQAQKNKLLSIQNTLIGGPFLLNHGQDVENTVHALYSTDAPPLNAIRSPSFSFPYAVRILNTEPIMKPFPQTRQCHKTDVSIPGFGKDVSVRWFLYRLMKLCENGDIRSLHMK